MKAKGYSLWLMPTGKIYAQLATLILQLSKKYKAPKFEPHVTLLGQVLGSKNKVFAKTSQLAAQIHPYEIGLSQVDYLDEYFRCLFIRARKTKSVLEANLKATKIFGRESDPEYMPHLSLMYGHFPPQTKKEIISKIGRSFDISFNAAAIHVVSTREEVKDWHRLKDFPLKP